MPLDSRHSASDSIPQPRWCSPWALVALALLSIAGHARADLMLFPTRVVFEQNVRAMQVELINNGKESATYRITLVNRRMNETGAFLPAEQAQPGERFAHELVRYSPRQVVLAPGGGQTIRIAVRKPADLPVGEYRSHLQFDRVPDPAADTGIVAAAAGAAPAGVGVELKMLIGASIPVIVRHGETGAALRMSRVELVQPEAGEPPAVSVDLHRTGNASAYGDLAATFTPAGGAPQQVGKAGGVAVYVPNALRRMRLELKPPTGLALTRGTLRVSYRERPEAGGKLLAEAAIDVP